MNDNMFNNTIISEINLNEAYDINLKKSIYDIMTNDLCNKEKEIEFDDIMKEGCVDHQILEIDPIKDVNTKLLVPDKNSDKKFNDYKNYLKLIGSINFDSVKELNGLSNKYINNQLFLIAIVKKDINLVSRIIKLGYKPTINDFIMSTKSNYEIYFMVKKYVNPSNIVLKKLCVCSFFIQDIEILSDLCEYDMTPNIFLRVSKYISDEDKEKIFKCATNNYNMYKNEEYTEDILCPIISSNWMYDGVSGHYPEWIGLDNMEIRYRDMFQRGD